ncbi:MAG: nitrous oxide reductase accessory protein NosL [Phycisphaerales bacterium]
MNTRAACVLSVSVIAAVSTAGCDSAPLSGPPTLRAGRDECRECGMIISEDRHACAMLVESSGFREHILFDDIGCMLDLERAGPEKRTILERHVHDFVSKSWVPAETASFLFADPGAAPTPMGSGIIAYASRLEAQAGAERTGGVVLDYAGLREARRAWMEQRYGKPGG